MDTACGSGCVPCGVPVNLLAAWNWLLELEQPVQVLQKDLQMVQFDA